MQYKCYLLANDGHIVGSAIEFDSQDDRSAIKEANLVATKFDVELWQGARLVGYVVSDVTKQKAASAKASRGSVQVERPS